MVHDPGMDRTLLRMGLVRHNSRGWLDLTPQGRAALGVMMEPDWHSALTVEDQERIYDEENPRCDICDEPMVCSRGDTCTVHAGDWNGDTGNHRSCERVRERDYALGGAPCLICGAPINKKGEGHDEGCMGLTD